MLAAIKGKSHSIRFTRAGRPAAETLRPIVVGYPMRFDFLCVDYPRVPAGYEKHFAKYAPKTYEASGITIHNDTAHPVILGDQSRENAVTSRGPVTDRGRGNGTGRTGH